LRYKLEMRGRTEKKFNKREDCRSRRDAEGRIEYNMDRGMEKNERGMKEAKRGREGKGKTKLLDHPYRFTAEL